MRELISDDQEILARFNRSLLESYVEVRDHDSCCFIGAIAIRESASPVLAAMCIVKGSFSQSKSSRCRAAAYKLLSWSMQT